MKAYTDLSQSKKLAEILPLESADMYYWWGEDVRLGGYKAQDTEYDIPCWSLAALLSVLPRELHFVLAILAIGINSKFAVGSVDDNSYDCIADNPVDACVDVILKLKERNLL